MSLVQVAFVNRLINELCMYVCMYVWVCSKFHTLCGSAKLLKIG